MVDLRNFVQRHALVAGFLAVLVPLLVLLGFQSVWLHKLERASTVAEKAALDNYLEAIDAEIQRHYTTAAERALSFPPAVFVNGSLDRAVHHWQKKPVEGVRLLFLVDFTRERFGNYMVFDPERGSLFTPPASDETLAIIVATTPWQVLSYRGVPVDSPAITVDERNLPYRIILNPITDDASMLVGIAGMVLDNEFFRREVLPSIARKARPAFLPDADEPGVSLLLRTRSQPEPGVHGVTRPLSFVFSDFSLLVDAADFAPGRWAKASFAFNMALSALLAALLLGGILLALRTANRAMKLSQMKSEFVSNISHELRTPLASIRMFAELLRLGKTSSTEKVREYGEYIDAESRRLSRLIDNILDFSRIESGRKVYRFVRGDLLELVEAVVHSFEVRLRHDGFIVRFFPPGGAFPEVEMDGDAVSQALHNLLDNAVKYSGASREIAIRLAPDGDGVILSVQDHGIGIPRDEQEKIFDRFHRVGTGLVHDVKGSGLGLSIVHHIVKAHRGHVAVESEPGKGSTFSIWLPAAPAEPDRATGGTP